MSIIEDLRIMLESPIATITFIGVIIGIIVGLPMFGKSIREIINAIKSFFSRYKWIILIFLVSGAILSVAMWAFTTRIPPIEKQVVQSQSEEEQIEPSAEEMISKGLQYFSEENYNEAINWLTQALEQGCDRAQSYLETSKLNLGLSYNSMQDYEQAIYWFRQIAEQDNTLAQHFLGFFYFLGRGVSQDFEQAVYWFRQVAEQGDASAQYFLGLSYLEGLGVEQNYEYAIKWFRKAAEQGFTDAQNALANSYFFGLGVEPNLEYAEFWFGQATEERISE